MKQFSHSVLAHLKNSWERHGKTIIISSSATTITVLVLAGGLFAYAKAYDGHIYPNVTVNGVEVGGLTQAEAREALELSFEEMLNTGLNVEVEDRAAFIDLRSSGATDPDLIFDLMDYNSDAGARGAFEIARTGNFLADQAYSLWLLVSPLSYNEHVVVLDEQIEDSILEKFGDLEQPGEPADFDITSEGDSFEVAFTPGTAGERLAIDTEGLSRDAQDLSLETLSLALVIEDDMITEEEALALEAEVVAALEAAPYELTHTTEGQRTFEWTVSQDELIEWLRPVRNDEGTVVLGLHEDQLEEFYVDLHNDIDVAPQNARFAMEDDRVVEFAGSLDGVSLDESETTELLLAGFGTEDSVIEVAVATVEPEIPTDSVNSLGISEIIGVGISDFSGSPSNRVSNIKHGANKLNGILIAPGETFSLVETLKPFDVSDGWLPELVIKGDEIKPEVGGGACQFGTTLFRAVMNSGLEVTERRNHSLVVGYYDDLSNGNPGTDATIYDPAPDFKFTNDFEDYVLLTTELDLSRSEMIFTFWGTSDGRIGSYTPPEVISWSGYGATQYKETTSLPPGVTRCQAPHAGATTSFDYTVEYADGTTHEENFTSIYRSLPRICLVGVGSVGAGETDGSGNYVGPPEEGGEGDGGDSESAEPVETAPELDVEDVPATDE